MLHHPIIQMMWDRLDEHYWGTRRLHIKYTQHGGYWIAIRSYDTHNNKCTENA